MYSFFTALIWYSGHGVEGTGDWVFCDGTISFSDIYDLYEKHFRRKLLTLVIDSCFAGQWALRLADYLTSQDIGACGHLARDKGILIQIFAACMPHEYAYDGLYSDKGMFINDKDSNLYFRFHRRLDDKQTPCTLNTTQICCFNSPQEECNWPSIPRGVDWSWGQLADHTERRNIDGRIFLFHGKNSGKSVWRYVIVRSHLVKKYLVALKDRSINLTEYGYILHSGWGENPPENITKKKNFTPQ